ncbi:MAG TPA: DUF4139 domain-containing protein [Clostridiaceae bacterium]|nr:DUF4139 domain-containing protein [Clostridiaceae bacterium]
MRYVSTSKDTMDLALTIYNDGFGTVKEVRKADIGRTIDEVLYLDVAKLIETDSLISEGLNIIEFNYDYDLVSREKLLGKYIDRNVTLKNRKSGETREVRVLSAEGTLIFEDIETKEIYLDSRDELILPSLPEGLMVKPSLIWKIGETELKELKTSYISQGFSWTANYVVELKGDRLNIVGWATIMNQSGRAYENARLKLIAGEVKRMEDKEAFYDIRESRVYAPSMMPAAEEKAFFDYHMYTLNHRTDLRDNQTKQVNIFVGEDVPYERYYKAHNRDERARITLEFQNREDVGLGKPMPKGTLKIYQADEADDSLEFLGEDHIEHTPKGERVILDIGEAFDITLEDKETARRSLEGFDYVKRETVIRNHKEEEVLVHFSLSLYERFEIEKASHDYEMEYSGTLLFKIRIPKDSETKVRVEYISDKRIHVRNS